MARPQPAAVLERVGLALARLGLEPSAMPAPFYDGYLGLIAARTVLAGTRLGVIAALVERPADAESLAARLGLDAERLDVLLTALTSLGYVRRHRDGRFTATRRSRRWLGGGGVGVEAIVGELAYGAWERMGSLEEVLAGGEPAGWHEVEADDPLWGGYQRAMAEMEAMTAPALAATIPAESPRRLLDLGGGPGLHAAEMCRRHPGLRATVLDLEGATRHARPLGGVTFVTDDLFEADLGEGYDLVTAHSLLHNFPRDRCLALLRRAREALAPGGLLAVQELERAPSGRAGTLMASLGGVAFLTSMGSRTYTADELSAMVSEAGFVGVELRRPPRLASNVVVLARRPENG